jgi:hypothetical protein
LARLHSAVRSVQRRARTRITIPTGTTTRRQPTMRRHQLIIRRREAAGTRITGAITRANRTELKIFNSRCRRQQTGGIPMLRIGLAATICAGLLALSPSAQSVQPNPNVIEAQWPGWQGGPGYGQEWEGRREHCLRMRERLREIRYRMETAAPWERDRLGTRFYEVRERLRNECWGHWRED